MSSNKDNKATEVATHLEPLDKLARKHHRRSEQSCQTKNHKKKHTRDSDGPRSTDTVLSARAANLRKNAPLRGQTGGEMAPGVDLDAVGQSHGGIQGRLGEVEAPEARVWGTLAGCHATHNAVYTHTHTHTHTHTPASARQQTTQRMQLRRQSMRPGSNVPPPGNPPKPHNFTKAASKHEQEQVKSANQQAAIRVAGISIVRRQGLKPTEVVKSADPSRADFLRVKGMRAEILDF